MAKTDRAPLKNIYLCGFMCAGKTSTGRALARLLGMPFADTDAMAERAAGEKTGALVARYGLARFRGLEAAQLRRVSACGGKVVALGGGLLPRGRRAALLRRTGVTVFLSCAWPELRRRLRRARAGRPLLAGPWPEAEERAVRLLARRLPFYKKAALQVETGGLDARAAAAAVQKALKRGGHL